MPNRARMSWDQIIGGRPGPWWGPLARAVLRASEVPYRWAVAWRNRRYEQGRAVVQRVSVPVVSVGNITAGGTGKTPLVAWLGQWFTQRGLRVAFVSRGYKSGHGKLNDEARVLRQIHPEIPHIQNPDRVAAARQAIRQFNAQVIILDDAFQHRRIHRDLDIVLIDALRPFGYRHLLPRGLLREPLNALRRADVVGLSRADAVEAHHRQVIHDEITALAPHCGWIELAHKPSRLINAEGEESTLDRLTACHVVAFCGIGNPKGFQATLGQLGCQIRGFHVFPDHHDYGRADLELLRNIVATTQPAPEVILCTHKDLVKLDATAVAGVPVWAVDIEIDIGVGRRLLEETLERLLLE